MALIETRATEVREEVTQALFDLLCDDSPSVSAQATLALGAMEWVTPENLIRAVLQGAAQRPPATKKEPGSVLLIGDLLHDISRGYPGARLEAAAVLGAVTHREGWPLVIPALLDRLCDRHPGVALAAATALGVLLAKGLEEDQVQALRDRISNIGTDVIISDISTVVAAAMHQIGISWDRPDPVEWL